MNRNIKLNTVSENMKDETVEIKNYQCRMISSKGKGSSIVLLHGFMFTSDVWNEIGLLRILEQRNIPFKALDMPYGKISECSPRTNDVYKNMELLSSIAGKDPVIVGASLGGFIALKYSVSHPVRGLLLAAPVMSMQKELMQHYKTFNSAISIIYGEKDNIVSANEMKKLSQSTNTKLKIYKEASHAAYLDYPEQFVKDVLELYDIATGNHEQI